jgi:hypothetical protein
MGIDRSLPEVLDHLLAESPLTEGSQRNDHVLTVTEVVREDTAVA